MRRHRLSVPERHSMPAWQRHFASDYEKGKDSRESLP